MLLLLIIHNNSQVLYMHYHFILKVSFEVSQRILFFCKRKPRFQRLSYLPDVTLPGNARSRGNPESVLSVVNQSVIDGDSERRNAEGNDGI